MLAASTASAQAASPAPGESPRSNRLPSGGVDASVLRDLTAVVALLGQPCVGGVKDYEWLGDNNYLAHCEAGDVYHVFLDPNGRVRVTRQ